MRCSRPYDELIFERADPPASASTDSIQTLILTNTGDKILTFKIKTTSPEKFRVKPGCSLLHPGASATVSVYLLKGKSVSTHVSSTDRFFAAHCAPNSVIQKEKFLIIWTLIGQEMKQPQLTEFWKTVPSSVLYEHRCVSIFDRFDSTDLVFLQIEMFICNEISFPCVCHDFTR